MKISADRQTRNRATKLASRPYIALLDHHLDSDRNPKFNALGDWNPITLPVENATHIILKETTNKTSSYTKHAFKLCKALHWETSIEGTDFFIYLIEYLYSAPSR